MLKPEYLRNVPNAMVELYEQVEADIIADMAKRIAAMDYYIPAAEWQMKKLEDMGLTREAIIKRLTAASGKTESELRNIIKQAGNVTLQSDNDVYRRAGIDPAPAAASESLQRIIEMGYRKTLSSFKNIAGTTANAATKQFEDALDRAWLQINTGAFSPQEAIKNAIKTLTESGLETITYESGRKDYMDTAVRRATLTGVNQTGAGLQEVRAEELGCDLVETTAHAGARPTHAVWQGQIFSLSGKSDKYPSLREVTGYGTVTGLCGANCRHSFFPYFEGTEQAYTKEMLEDYEAEKYTYNGRKMTEYEAIGRQREIERKLRRWKREEKAMAAAGLPTDEAKAKIKYWNSVQKDYLEQTGLKRQYDRERIGKNGKYQLVPSDIKHGEWKANFVDGDSKIGLQGDSKTKKEIDDSYKKALFDYMSAKSYIINEKLRNGAALTKEEKELTIKLDNALAKLPKYEGNLCRSLYFTNEDSLQGFLKEYAIGESITYREYLSTTKGEIYNPDGQVQIYIRNAKKGRDLAGFNDAEAEVLYERNASFKIKNIIKIGGKYYILLTESDE